MSDPTIHDLDKLTFDTDELRTDAVTRVWEQVVRPCEEITTFGDACAVACLAAEPAIGALERLLANVTGLKWVTYRVGSRDRWLCRVIATRVSNDTWMIFDGIDSYWTTEGRWTTSSEHRKHAGRFTLVECLELGEALAIDLTLEQFAHLDIPYDELRVSPTGRPLDQED